MKSKSIMPVVFAVCLILFNIAIVGSDHLVNCSPIIAALFCGAAFYRQNNWLLPTAAFSWLISISYTSSMHGDYSMWSLSTLWTLLSFAVVVGIGSLFRKSQQPLSLIAGTLAAACSFYFITNTFSFALSPLYAKTYEGYVQAMWTGLPQFNIPTWVFFRNSLLSSGVFTTLFLTVMHIPIIKKASQFKLANA